MYFFSNMGETYIRVIKSYIVFIIALNSLSDSVSLSWMVGVSEIEEVESEEEIIFLLMNKKDDDFLCFYRKSLRL